MKSTAEIASESFKGAKEAECPDLKRFSVFLFSHKSKLFAIFVDWLLQRKILLEILGVIFSFFVGWEMGYWTAKWPGAWWQVVSGKWQVAGGRWQFPDSRATPHKVLRVARLVGLFVKRTTAGLLPHGMCLGGWVLQKLFWVFSSFFSMAVCACWVYKYALFFSERKHSPVGPSVDCTSGGHNN